jgi:hypothetical protein
MNPEDQAELLVEIKTKLDTLIRQFDKVSNGIGFPRCAERKEQITSLFKRIEKLENHNSWLWRSLGGAVIVGVIVELVRSFGG